MKLLQFAASKGFEEDLIWKLMKINYDLKKRTAAFFIRETQISGVSKLKFVSRTIPPQAEGIIPRSSAVEFVSEFSELLGFHTRD